MVIASSDRLWTSMGISRGFKTDPQIHTSTLPAQDALDFWVHSLVTTSQNIFSLKKWTILGATSITENLSIFYQTKRDQPNPCHVTYCWPVLGWVVVVQCGPMRDRPDYGELDIPACDAHAIPTHLITSNYIGSNCSNFSTPHPMPMFGHYDGL